MGHPTRPPERFRPMQRAHSGFALPLAIVVLVAFSLAIGLIVDGAVSTFRAASADFELARAGAAAESALAEALDSRLDTAVLHLAPGTVLSHDGSAAPDSVETTVQLLLPPMVRILVVLHSRHGGLRVSAGRLATGRLSPDQVSAGDLRIIPTRSAWWVPIP